MSPLPLVLHGLEAFLLKHRGGLRCGQGSQFRGLTAFSQDHGFGVTIGCVQVFAVAQQISVQLWRVNVGLELLNESKDETRSDPVSHLVQSLLVVWVELTFTGLSKRPLSLTKLPVESEQDGADSASLCTCLGLRRNESR